MEVVPDGSVVAALEDARRFTGRVWRTDHIEPAGADDLAGLRLVYEPGARSAWHVHEREQAIVAVHGRGLVAWEGLDAPVELGSGDWWHVEPGIAHWHGATPDSTFAHIAVSTGGTTTWLRPVTDAEYLSRAGVHRRGDDR